VGVVVEVLRDRRVRSANALDLVVEVVVVGVVVVGVVVVEVVVVEVVEAMEGGVLVVRASGRAAEPRRQQRTRTGAEADAEVQVGAGVAAGPGAAGVWAAHALSQASDGDGLERQTGMGWVGLVAGRVAAVVVERRVSMRRVSMSLEWSLATCCMR
jgi:hypothetical protein